MRKTRLTRGAGLGFGLLLLILVAAGAPAGPVWASENRTMDGSGNNAGFHSWGRAGTSLLRLTPAAYADSVSQPGGSGRPGPRILSNQLCVQHAPAPNEAGATSLVWQWGQFLDHDVDLTPENPGEYMPIQIPAGDPDFDPMATGTQTMPFRRSGHDPATGTGSANPRQQINAVSAFIDASNVYGSTDARATALRTLDGTGRLATSAGGQFLPFNVAGLENAGGTSRKLFLAGDVRANEQVALTSMHTLFVREHNRLCDEIHAEHSELDGEEIYQQARKRVGAFMQVITFQEFLPVLLGDGALPSYAGYDAGANPGITNEFSTAAYRFGHSMLPGELMRINRAGRAEVPTSLRDAFFNPRLIHRGGGIEPLLRGLTLQMAEEVDGQMVDGLRNFLFGAPGEGGIDLASLNIQRGRDHGLADYNTTRAALGLIPAVTFSELTSDAGSAARLEASYGDVEDVDLWIGGLAEDHMPGAMVGETFYVILVDQFTRLRDGDRFWYRNDPFFLDRPSLLTEIENTRLIDIIRRNTRIGSEVGESLFRR